MYLLGLSALRIRNRGTTGRAATFGGGLTDGESPKVLGLADRRDDPTEPRREPEDFRCLGVHCIEGVSAVRTVATEDLPKWEKLTPRRIEVLGRTKTGGLLGRYELAREERDIELFRTYVNRCEGALRFEEVRVVIDPRFELVRAWIRSELPVRCPKAVAGLILRLAELEPRCTVMF
jgi:hypothetical protein